MTRSPRVISTLSAALLMGCLVASGFAIGARPAAAQGFDLASGGAKNAPVEVYADDGVEWSQDSTRFIARGNAKAVRGTVTVFADVLTAHYREKDGNSEVWRLDAEGNVRIVSPKEQVTGDTATYDLDKAVMVVRGQPVARLVTPTDTVTATESLEYWEKRRQAVARGDALAVRGVNRLRGDVLTADFTAAGKGPMKMSTAQAVGNVVLTTPKDVVTGERGTYNLQNGIATLTGSVKITSDENQLNGGYAQVNTKTGISQVFAAPPGQAGSGSGEKKRVRVLLVPGSKTDASNEDGSKAQPDGTAPAGRRQ